MLGGLFLLCRELYRILDGYGYFFSPVAAIAASASNLAHIPLPRLDEEVSVPPV
jgi:hypothetical protein